MPTREEIMGELAEQSAYDPWERAAAAVRFGAKPLGGRQGDPDRIANIASAPLRAAAGFTKAAFDRAAEEHGGGSQLSTDYDPRATGAFLGAETAMNTVGLPALTGGVPASAALGSAAKSIRPALPMDEASRMARAAEQGFTRDVYHGTVQTKPGAEEFTRFRRSTDDDFPIPGVSTTGDPGTASFYATTGRTMAAADPVEGMAVMPLKVRGNYPDLLEFADRFETRTGKDFGKASDKEVLRFAKREDIQGVYTPENDEYRIFDPRNIRSRFAAFDPANKDSGFLLGSNFTDRKTGAVLGGLAATDEYRPPFYSAVDPTARFDCQPNTQRAIAA